MVREDRRIRGEERPTLAIVLTWAIVSAVLIGVFANDIMSGEYHGPDDALRMVQVRDLLAGQGWYDLHQYRMTPPEGTLMHWSRLVDIPIAAFVLLFSLFLHPAPAESAAMVAVPLLVLLLTMLVIGRLSWRLFDRKTAVLVCLVLMMMPMIVVQFRPLRIDHHSWQILTIGLAVWALSWRKPAQGGAAAGLAMAVGLMISLEVIFMSAAFALVLFLRWLRDQSARWWLVSYLQALALGMVVLFVATRGWADIAQHCDVISPAHLGFFVIVALGAGALAVPAAIPRIPLIVGLGVSGLAGLAFIGSFAPECMAPPFAGLDPLVREFWYLNVSEGRPFWHAPTLTAIAAVVQPLIAIAVALYLAGNSRAWTREWWFEYALLLGIAYIAGLMTFRSIAFASILAALPIGWFLMRLLERWRAHKTLLPKLGLAVIIYITLLPAFPVILYNMLVKPQAEDEIVAISRSSCELRQNAVLLNQLPAGTAFAPLDLGPVLLYKTHHSVVASGHHRAEMAMRDVIDGFISSPDRARQYIEDYGADYVFACTDLQEPQNYLDRGGDETMTGLLLNGNSPEWLEEVELGGPDTLRAWRVVRD